MRKLKLSLKKEVISGLESKEVKGGAHTLNPNCPTNVHSCANTCNITDGIHTCPSNIPTCKSYETICTQ